MSTAGNRVYFIGIGGIGMSALARWYMANGFEIAGYDRTPTALTTQLQEENMFVHFKDVVEEIPPAFLEKNTLVIYTPAIPQDNVILRYFISQGYKVIKRAEALGDVTREVFTVAVAGTHGKTTTSSMIAHVLREAGKNCFAFIGGITQNYNSNLLFGDFAKENKIMVVEADEYDRSFHRLRPDVAVITAMDPDHLDIYTDENEFQEAFDKFVEKLSDEGHLIYKHGLKIAAAKPGQHFASFGMTGADYAAIITDESNFVFDIENGQERLTNVRLGTPGFHNIQNALAAYGAARSLDISPEVIKQALENFKGVKRRFDFIVNNGKTIYIDDYAHHPTEIFAFLRSVKSMFSEKKLTAIFQPHLFSRTRDFMEGFAESLSLADKLILLDIYPARELPIPGVTSEILLEKVTSKEKILLKKNELMDYLSKETPEILVTIGAGDIDQFVMPIGNLFKSERIAG
jgi:UDP-N-acetylmuramate--alanine ligase